MIRTHERNKRIIAGYNAGKDRHQLSEEFNLRYETIWSITRGLPKRPRRERA